MQKVKNVKNVKITMYKSTKIKKNTWAPAISTKKKNSDKTKKTKKYKNVKNVKT